MLTHKKSLNSYFISIEGVEGAGKSTQIKLLQDFLESKGYRVLLTREPGGTVFGESLRQAILNSKQSLTPISEAYLFASSRAQLLQEVILPHLEQDKSVVIADRYLDSSFVYQGLTKGLGIEEIERIHTPYPLNQRPDLTFYLQIDLNTSLDRQSHRGNKKDYFEKEDNSFHQKLIDGFDKISQIFTQRIKTIDATKSPTEVSNQMIPYIVELIEND